MRRRRKSNEEWQRLLAEFDRAGLTVAEFCQVHDVAKSSFHKRRSAAGGVKTSQSFVAAKLPRRSNPSVTIEVGDLTIRCDAQAPVDWLSGLVTALRS